MKLSKYIVCALAAGFLATSCEDKVEEQFIPNPAVDFTYEVQGDEYKYDFYVVSTIQFNNTSSESGACTWDFGDGTTSNEVSPAHKYEKAGLYRVKLTIDGKGTREYPLLVYDIVPVLSIADKTTEVVEFNNTLVSFNLELPNPEKLKVSYQWTFPEGTVDENGQPITSFLGGTNDDGSIVYPPRVKFSNIGSQKVQIRTMFDLDGANRRLQDAYMNVQVGVSTPAPTLYYAQKGGNIKAYKLIDNVPAGCKVLPYDLGVPAGAMVFNLLYSDVTVATENADGTTGSEKQGWVYILDAGKQYYYINDEGGVLGDGKITAMRTDGTGVNTVVSNVGGAAFLDPFIGAVYNGKIYYTDRNTGCSAITETERGQVQAKKSSTQRDSYAFENNLIPYYGRGISYGAISNGLYRDSKGYWWWGKKYNGNGIFRFQDKDVYTTQADAEKATLPTPLVLNGLQFSCFAIDEARKGLYVWRRTPSPGFVHWTLPSNTEGLSMDANPVAYVAMNADPVNTTESEGVLTTQMAVDPSTGRVYFCYRPVAGDDSKIPAGINYYDPTDNKVHKYGTDADLGMGIVINPNKTKLF